MAISVSNEITLYKKDGEKVPVGEEKLVIASHWNSDRLVHLKYGDLDIVVPAGELKAAIDNATNTAKHSY